ncbi:MAG: hypothetical protein RBT34_13205 [Anaerolineaceae bacterium]|jgi:hypothetical protein|nr:hypothetical protein [Anaerolineaceae bacterium]
MERDDFHTSMLVQLGDDGGDRFASGVLDEALRQVLNMYSQSAPRLLSGTLTLTGAGQMQSLAVLSGLLEVVEVVFPYDAAAAVYRSYAQPWQFAWRDSSPLLWLGGQPVPQAGEVLHVTYSAAHRINGLDGALATTLPAEHETVISSGAAALAANGRALRLVEAHGSRTDEAGKWLACAAPLEKRFHAFLDGLRSSGRVRPPVWRQERGWRLDGWDV